MNVKLWTILAATISTTALADQPPVEPTNSGSSSTPAPARTSVRYSTAADLHSTPLTAGPAVVVANRVNVRGRAGLIGEVIGKLSNGDTVMVIEEVTLKNSKPDEPSAWAKISLPPSIKVWVHTSFLDRESMTVKATRLNLRGGPGENYSVLGRLEKGTPVREIQTKGDWMQIEAPDSAYAFVAAQYLKQEPAPVIVQNTPPLELAPAETATVTETPDVAPGVEAPDTTEIPAAGMAEFETEIPMDETPVIEEPLPPRIVQREGIVRGTVSIQAPTKFALYNPDNLRAINYLYTSSTNLDLSRYKGLRIIVTGEEGLDERWKNTPVITIQQIRVIE